MKAYTKCYMQIFKFSFIILIVHVCLAQAVMAQPKTYSPLTRIGLGQIMDYDFMAQDAMGGISAAYHDPVYANPSNAASLSWLRTASMDIGVYAANTKIDAVDGVYDYWTGNITHLSIAFPIFNPINDLLEREERNYAWGMMIGLQPYSVVGYDIVTEEVTAEDGTIRKQYTGSGGTYAVMWGNGFRYKDFALGVRMEYMFGDIVENRNAEFVDLFNSFENDFRDDLNLSALRWDFGAQYKWVLKRAEKPDGTPGSDLQTLTLGATLQSSSNLRIKESRLHLLQHSIYPQVVDTLLFSEGENNNGVLPGGLSAGLFYQSKDKWELGADFDYGFWSNYENEIKPSSLKNTWAVSTGLGFTPDATNIDNYLKRVTYRAGFSYGLDPRIVNDKQIEEYSVSLGMSLPFIGRRRAAYGNFSFKYGERAITNGISETFFSIGFGFTAADNQWFIQSKFD